jgi:hypothetical protein
MRRRRRIIIRRRRKKEEEEEETEINKKNVEIQGVHGSEDSSRGLLCCEAM